MSTPTSMVVVTESRSDVSKSLRQRKSSSLSSSSLNDPLDLVVALDDPGCLGLAEVPPQDHAGIVVCFLASRVKGARGVLLLLTG